MTNVSPCVSIVVPVYKCEKFLRKCIDSILNQSFEDFELLLIDDGSPDLSGCICDEYASYDKRVRVYHKENGGVSSARNEGIKQSLGRWIVFVDSDDWVDKDYLSNFEINGIDSNEIIVLQGVWQHTARVNTQFFVYENDSFTLNNAEKIKGTDLFKDGCPFAKLFSLKIIREYNLFFDTNLSLNEDHLFVINYYRCIKKVYLKERMGYHYLYDFRSNSLTKKRHRVEESLLASKMIFESFEQMCKIHSLSQRDVLSKQSCRIFGFQQILRAMRDSCFEKEKYSLFCKCINFVKNEQYVKCDYMNFYELFSNFLWKYDFIRIGFLLNNLNVFFANYIYRLKYLVKNLILKKL